MEKLQASEDTLETKVWLKFYIIMFVLLNCSLSCLFPISAKLCGISNRDEIKFGVYCLVFEYRTLRI